MSHIRAVTTAVIMTWFLVGCPGGGSDTLHVTATTPGDEDSAVSIATVIRITFSEAANHATLDVEVTPDFEYTESWSGDKKTVTLTPAEPLYQNKVYAVTVWDVAAAAGGALDKHYTFTFTTSAGGNALDYREAMRTFVRAIGTYARQTDPGFLIVPQNGEALLTDTGFETGMISADYVAVIDGQGREDLYYGYERDNTPTSTADRAGILPMLEVAENSGVEVLVTDYCSTPAYVDDSYAMNAAHNFISFAAHRRDLDAIPSYPAEPYNANSDDINALSVARNMLYLLDPGSFADRQSYLAALADTDYDLLILDLFYDDDVLTALEVDGLRTKQGGGNRLLLAYMSIGEAEDYRYYWQSAWRPGSPAWMESENPVWAGNYKVRYWDPGWQAIIFGTPDAYLDRIMAAGFDGAYLDIIDAYEYFESQAR